MSCVGKDKQGHVSAQSGRSRRRYSWNIGIPAMEIAKHPVFIPVAPIGP
jgi:hypothetical protein